jgi:hypothetical protein
MSAPSPLLGAKRKSHRALPISAFDAVDGSSTRHVSAMYVGAV